MPPINQIYRSILRGLMKHNDQVLEVAKFERQLGSSPMEIVDTLSNYQPQLTNLKGVLNDPYTQGVKREIRGLPSRYNRQLYFQSDPLAGIGHLNLRLRDRPTIMYDPTIMYGNPGVLTHEGLHFDYPDYGEETIRALTEARLRSLGIKDGK